MFTGIVQGQGTIVAIEDKAGLRTYQVALPDSLNQQIVTGASIANDGCCLTITAHQGHQVSFDMMQETLKLTTLGDKKVGDKVNLERAARYGDEIGGHVMSGHIATKTAILAIDKSETNCEMTLALPPAFKQYILYKGFIGLDGCSLTIGAVSDSDFKIHLIPETLNVTTFGQKRVGDWLNVEIDPQTQAIVDTVERVLAEQRRV